MKFNLLTLAAMLVFVLWLVIAYPHTHLGPERIAGLAIGLAGLLLLVLARIQLGRAFSIQAKATTLVTTGLYSRIRNPIYIFGMLILVGLALYLERPWLLLFLVVLVPMQVIRAKKEEAVLTEKFGDAYRSYKTQTWF